MFERFTEKARRVIFFARYEAGQDGSSYIETWHLLLGLMRENTALFAKLGFANEPVVILMEVQKLAPPKGERTSTSVDMPLSYGSKHVMSFAAEEAGSGMIGPEHLLMGLLREDNPAGAILEKFGINLERARAGEVRESYADAAPALRNTLMRWSRRIHEASVQLRVTESVVRMRTPEGGWSRKEILGHLIDSASNNHQRFVRAQLEEELQFPAYEQEGWARTQHCEDLPLTDLVDLWVAYNRLLVHIASRIPEDKLGRLVRVGSGDPVTLQFLVTDYLDHMEHHLGQLGVVW
jgi:hypothetical protein